MGAKPEHFIDKVSQVQDASSHVPKLFEQYHPELPPPNAEAFQALMSRVSFQHSAVDDTLHKSPGEAPPIALEKDAQGGTLSDSSKQDTHTSLIAQVNRVGNRINTASFMQQPFPEQTQRIRVGLQQARVQTQQAQNLLQTPNLQIKNSVGQRMAERLGTVHADLKTMFIKVGQEFQIEAPSTTELTTPVKKFFNYLVDSEMGIQRLEQEVSHLDPKTFSPADMLTMQVKVVSVQQQLEFFTGLLNQSLQAVKALMNVQV